MAARVILLAGPSGAGKTRLARRSALPVMALDDFYKNGSDPTLPRRDTGLVDWDDPAAWDLDAALQSLHELCTTGTTRAPVYDISAQCPDGLPGARPRYGPIPRRRRHLRSGARRQVS